MNIAKDVFPEINKLIDEWCERRSLKPLRYILRSYPLHNGFTDEWGELLESLKDIKGLCKGELTSNEKKMLVEVIIAIENALHRRNQ